MLGTLQRHWGNQTQVDGGLTQYGPVFMAWQAVLVMFTPYQMVVGAVPEEVAVEASEVPAPPAL